MLQGFYGNEKKKLKLRNLTVEPVPRRSKMESRFVYFLDLNCRNGLKLRIYLMKCFDAIFVDHTKEANKHKNCETLCRTHYYYYYNAIKKIKENNKEESFVWEICVRRGKTQRENVGDKRNPVGLFIDAVERFGER